MRRTNILMLSLALMASCHAFTMKQPDNDRRAASFALNNSGGDFDGASIGDDADASSNSDGEALAAEFYKQMRERKEIEEYLDAGDDNEPDTTTKPKLSEEELRAMNRKPFSRRREMVGGKPVSSGTRKFTGQTSSTSAGLFSGRGASVYSMPSAIPNQRQRMMQSELDLAGRAQRMLLVQSVAAVFLLLVALFVGFTGGIEANTEAWNSMPDSADMTSMEGMEGIMPVPTDSEASVWL